jgi:hypothetical protein
MEPTQRSARCGTAAEFAVRSRAVNCAVGLSAHTCVPAVSACPSKSSTVRHVIRCISKKIPFRLPSANGMLLYHHGGQRLLPSPNKSVLVRRFGCTQKWIFIICFRVGVSGLAEHAVLNPRLVLVDRLACHATVVLNHPEGPPVIRLPDQHVVARAPKLILGLLPLRFVQGAPKARVLVG